MSQRCLNLCGLSVAFWVGCGGPSDPARREGVVSDSGFDDVDDDSGTGTDTGDASSVEGEWTFGVDTVRVSATVNAGRRTYTMSSTHPQRDGGPSQRTFSERDGDPLLPGRR